MGFHNYNNRTSGRGAFIHCSSISKRYLKVSIAAALLLQLTAAPPILVEAQKLYFRSSSSHPNGADLHSNTEEAAALHARSLKDSSPSNQSLIQPPFPMGDSNDPKCFDDSPDVIEFKGRATDSMPTEDTNGNGVLDPDEDINLNGILDTDSGIISVDIDGPSSNLQLDVDPLFTSGAGTVTFIASRVNDTLSAMGHIVVTDGAGNTCRFNVSLDPFDQDVFETQLGFPEMVYASLFNATPSINDTVPTYEALEFAEAVGTYSTQNYEGILFAIEVTAILGTSSELGPLILEESEPDVLLFVSDQNYQNFLFRGNFIAPDGTGESVEAVALAYTFDLIQPEYYIVVVYDPNDPELGLTDESDDLPEEVPSVGGRRLFRDQDEEEAAAIQSKRVLTPTSRFLQAATCAGALNEAISAFNCNPPDEILEVDDACVQAAQLAYNQAVAAARGEYDTAIEIARGVYKAALIAINAKTARDFARSLLPCVVIGVLSGPLGYAACAARALAIVIAKKVALQLAAKAALDLAKRNALAILQAALTAACAALKAALQGCLNCKQKPCDETSDCDTEEKPDPHFRTWNKEFYDFHGACDAVFVHNDLLDIHIRTERRSGWSGVSKAALRLGGEILEVLEDSTFLINGTPPDNVPEFLGGVYPLQVSSDRFKIELSGRQFVEFILHRNNIVVRVNGHGSDFFDSQGMAGTWNKFGLVGRDGVTTHTNATAFAVDWEVGPQDPVLFSDLAQARSCGTPPDSPLPPKVDVAMLEVAKEACSDLLEGQNARENCIFDVVTAGDPTWAENPGYVEPLATPAPRCAENHEHGTTEASTMTNTTTCALVGGRCVWRCSPNKYDCLPNLCSVVEGGAKAVVVHDHGRPRRLQPVEGCSCATPKASMGVAASSYGKKFKKTQKAKKNKAAKKDSFKL